MPKLLWERWVRIFVVLSGMLHNYFVSLLRILSSFWMCGSEKGTT